MKASPGRAGSSGWVAMSEQLYDCIMVDRGEESPQGFAEALAIQVLMQFALQECNFLSRRLY